MQELRRDLAAATRMLVDAGIVGYSGHLSARAGRDRLLIQPVDDVRAQLRPDRLLVVTLGGDVVDGDGQPPSELSIHTEIYRARPDVEAVAHFHHDPTTVFTLVDGCAVVPVKNHASRWAAGVPVHPDPSHIATAEQGRALAATLLGGAHTIRGAFDESSLDAPGARDAARGVLGEAGFDAAYERGRALNGDEEIAAAQGALAGPPAAG